MREMAHSANSSSYQAHREEQGALSVAVDISGQIS